MHNPRNTHCAQCRAKLCRREAHVVYLDIASPEEEQEEAVDTLVKGLNRMDGNSKVISVENARKKLKKFVHDSSKGAIVETLLQAIDDFKQRIAPVFTRAEEQAMRIDELARKLRTCEANLAQSVRLQEPLSKEVKKLRGDVDQMEQERDQAIDLARQASDETIQLRENLALSKARVSELENDTARYRLQLQGHNKVAKKHKQMIATLEQGLAQEIANKKEMANEDDTHHEVGHDLTYFSTQHKTFVAGSNPAMPAKPLTQPLSKHVVNTPDFAGRPPPGSGFQSDWQLSNRDTKKRKLGLENMVPADGRKFPLALDNKGRPIAAKPTGSLDVPDLQAVAKDHNIAATLIMCRMTIAIGVQCEKNKQFIDKIQGLSEADQHHLMKAIEQVMARITVDSGNHDVTEASMTEDDHYYRIQSEKSRIFSEKETLQKVYEALLDEHRALQTNFDDVVSEKEDALNRLKDVRREVDSKRSEKADGMMRAENERLRNELQKSEDNLAITESELEKTTNLITDLTKKIDELQPRADERDKLKDKLDEYRHAADKLQKTENVMEKYKKKLQEGADLRQRVKALEAQNADLVDRNASFEEEYRKVAAFKPLMESYKNQIADLESKNSTRAQENDALKFELEQSRTKLKITLEERAKDSETLELYQERVRELELSSHRPVGTTRAEGERADQHDPSTDFTESELLGVTSEATHNDDDDDHAGLGLDGELDDAIAGTTMTDLKLQIRKLKRELEAVRKNEVDASRVLVLENLLEDANRMKARYEGDYLAAHREKLVLQRDLEEIRSGKSFGDGAEAAIALRQRLNETVEQFEDLRKEHAELEVKFDTQSRELTIARSDLNLVNKDQLDILATLRESVNEDKAGLEADVERLQKQNKELNEKNRMQLEQVNVLLLEKVNLQSEGIGHREKMLQRERDFGDLRASISGKDVPEDIKARLLALHEENVNLKEAHKTAQEKLSKAKAFIKSQDKLFKEQHALASSAVSPGLFEEAETSFRSQIKVLEEEVARQKQLMTESTRRYRREQELMLSAVHVIGMRTMRTHLGGQPREPSSWLGQTRQKLTSRTEFCEGMLMGMASVVIDGSVLEGGGQILRNSISLAALLSKSVSIHKIRNARKPPGLKNQHRTGLQLAAEIASATLTGATNGSTVISFTPGPKGIVLPGTFVADSVTAGSTTLLLQIALPLLLFTRSSAQSPPPRSTLTLLGGTNATQAPQIDYTKHVFLPFVQRHFGVHDVTLEIARRGYFPRGGGEVRVGVGPLVGTQLSAARVLERGRVRHVGGIAHFAGLPASVGREMVLGARRGLGELRFLNEEGEVPSVDIQCRREDTTGAGSGIVLWAELEGGGVIGGSAVGTKATQPHEVGRTAAEELLRGLRGGGCVDEWLQDQIIVFMALAHGTSEIKCAKGPLELHTHTAIWLAEQMTDAKFEVAQTPDGHSIIRCQGIGYTPDSLPISDSALVL
ncbi:hypothetical protein DXG03_007217 [Asterophora parasitica]|uniref:RNA 3'-terminal-phosphate cyclase (ATP) n=1 Tax=Asterophora parasitica TaxID=117018 RepID=A0A9P7G7P3_9AGAR|nr:hypothetical protein DXG03_007217 [Asterophora parasitica]